MRDDETTIAVRGDGLRLRQRLDGEMRVWSVEELEDGRVAGATTFAPADARAAIDLLDTQYLAQLDGEPALEAALRWGLAHRAHDVDAFDRLMADASELRDHRHLGLGDIPKAQLLVLLEPVWGASVSLVSEYERWSDRAVLARVIYLGPADAGAEPSQESRSSTVFAVDHEGRITGMDVYDSDTDLDAARSRYEEVSAATPPPGHEART